MAEDIPPPHHLSARTVLAIGICRDALVPFLYYLLVETSFDVGSYPFGFKLLGLASSENRTYRDLAQVDTTG